VEQEDFKTCSTCYWWRDGFCDIVGDDDQSPKLFEIVVTVVDDYGLSSKLRTGPDFGCVHHFRQLNWN
jgi:hypothetical protein